MLQPPKAKCQQDITTVDEFYMMAKEVQRQLGQKINSAQTEDRRFRDFFGAGVHVGHHHVDTPLREQLASRRGDCPAPPRGNVLSLLLPRNRPEDMAQVPLAHDLRSL
jgi:hypothetical protein